MRTFVVILPYIFASLHFSGCGAGDKWVNLVNTPSGIKVSGRYVTATKSIKVQAEDKGLKLDFGLPESLPRVHSDRISIHLRKMDFGEFITNTQHDWVAKFSSASSLTSECTATETKFTRSFSIDGADKETTVSVKQENNGLLALEAKMASKDDPVVRLRTKPLKDVKTPNCVTAWTDEESIAQVVTDLLKVRQKFNDMLASAAGFDGSKTGSRLSRKPNTITTEGERAEKEDEGK
jgi:hypothetical protein